MASIKELTQAKRQRLPAPVRENRLAVIENKIAVEGRDQLTPEEEIFWVQNSNLPSDRVPEHLAEAGQPPQAAIGYTPALSSEANSIVTFSLITISAADMLIPSDVITGCRTW